jgi:hypothetical protein
MSFINLDLTGVKEGEIVPEGEYDLRIVKVEDGESRKGNQMTTVTIRIEGTDVPNPAPVQHYITYPTPDLPDNQKYMRLLDIKRFLTLFEVPFDKAGFDSEELLGQTARGMLTQEEGNDGIIRNRLRLPRLRE